MPQPVTRSLHERFIITVRLPCLFYLNPPPARSSFDFLAATMLF